MNFFFLFYIVAVIAVYVKCNGFLWGSKPGADTLWPINNKNQFFILNWASPNTNDKNCEELYVVLLKSGPSIPVLGTFTLPKEILDHSLASISLHRPLPNILPSPIIPDIWPPSSPGQKIISSFGRISFAGYTFNVKDSHGQYVGPGPNIFSNTNIFVDAYGLHHLLAPIDSSNCNSFAASEVELDHTLGYGTYLVSSVGAFNENDPDVTISPFFLWDNTGNNNNGFREIDIEHAR